MAIGDSSETAPADRDKMPEWVFNLLLVAVTAAVIVTVLVVAIHAKDRADRKAAHRVECLRFPGASDC